MQFLNTLIDVVFPKTCVFCSESGSYFCKDCLNLSVPYKPCCSVCGKMLASPSSLHVNCTNNSYLDGFFSCVEFDNYSQKVIYEIKYNFYYSIAYEIGLMMKNSLQLWGVSYDAIVPVPLSYKRYNWRGFNQSTILAKTIDSKKYANLLVRTRNTKTQVGLKKLARQKNLKNAFKTKQKPPENIVIVDDVFTTGTTLQECAKALKRSGAKKVYGLTWATRM